MNDKKNILYADDDYESINILFRLRAPSLFIGLVLGVIISILVSRFEEVLSKNIQIAFFLPFVVYIANAIGAQTGNIYARDLKSGRAKFSKYFRKELLLGVIFGLIFGIVSGVIIFLWLGNIFLAFSVAASTCLAIAVAPTVALVITYMFQFLHDDPAAYSGPIATVIQDMISVVIYGIISSIILL